MAFPKKTQPVDTLNQTLEIPIKEPKEGVFSTHLRYQIDASQLIRDPTNTNSDNRYNELVDQWISMIPNVKKQEEFRKVRADRIRERIGALDNPNEDEKGRELKAISREISGMISAYMDTYAGGERENRISFIVPNKALRLWLEQQNPEHFAEHPEKLQEGYEQYKADIHAKKTAEREAKKKAEELKPTAEVEHANIKDAL